jgi:hypothetical protein
MEHPGHYVVGMGCGCASAFVGLVALLVIALMIALSHR